MEYSTIIIILIYILLFPFIYNEYINPVRDTEREYLIYLLLIILVLTMPIIVKLFIRNSIQVNETYIRMIMTIVSVSIFMTMIIILYY